MPSPLPRACVFGKDRRDDRVGGRDPQTGKELRAGRGQSGAEKNLPPGRTHRDELIAKGARLARVA